MTKQGFEAQWGTNHVGHQVRALPCALRSPPWHSPHTPPARWQTAPAQPRGPALRCSHRCAAPGQPAAAQAEGVWRARGGADQLWAPLCHRAAAGRPQLGAAQVQCLARIRPGQALQRVRCLLRLLVSGAGWPAGGTGRGLGGRKWPGGEAACRTRPGHVPAAALAPAPPPAGCLLWSWRGACARRARRWRPFRCTQGAAGRAAGAAHSAAACRQQCAPRRRVVAANALLALPSPDAQLHQHSAVAPHDGGRAAAHAVARHCGGAWHGRPHGQQDGASGALPEPRTPPLSRCAATGLPCCARPSAAGPLSHLPSAPAHRARPPACGPAWRQSCRAARAPTWLTARWAPRRRASGAAACAPPRPWPPTPSWPRRCGPRQRS